jgi:hypothetical protein
MKSVFLLKNTYWKSNQSGKKEILRKREKQNKRTTKPL